MRGLSTLVLMSLAACGRIGFDRPVDGDGSLIGDDVPADSMTPGAWDLATPAVSPSGAFLCGIAYDSNRRRVRMYGGSLSQTVGTRSNETWEWDGTSWTKLDTPVTPGQRSVAAIAYDSVRDRMVMHGNVGAMNDTWELAGTTWTQRTPTISPSGRAYSSMAYDPIRGVTVLFGGDDSAGGYYDETWEWDGTTWTQRNPPVKPPSRAYHAMAWDPVRARIVVFGGSIETTPSLADDLWEYDGTTWVDRSPTMRPPQRRFASIMFDTNRERLVIFGGQSYTSVLSDTWEWDGATWTQRSTSGPGSRYQHAMAFDPERGGVLFGGRDDTTIVYGDTWIY